MPVISLTVDSSKLSPAHYCTFYITEEALQKIGDRSLFNQLASYIQDKVSIAEKDVKPTQQENSGT